MTREIFVFGSNLSGIHGAGAAKHALSSYGAVWGQGEGLQGDSYGIPTKAKNVRDSLSLSMIESYVADFIWFARKNPKMRFMITPIGTGFAGYTTAQIRPMFNGAPDNCIFPEEWWDK